MADLSKHSIRQTVGAFERVMIGVPAWDMRSPDPARNYGVHGVEMSFAVIRAGAAVEFERLTGWQLPHVREELGRQAHAPLPGMVRYHAPAPWADYLTEPSTDACGYTGGGCYADGSGLDGYGLFDVLVTDGLDGVWRELEQRWVSQFGARYA